MPASTQTASGSGRYLQMNMDGRTYLQIDHPTPESCKKHGVSNPNPNVEMLCTTVSQSAMLPKLFMLTNVLTDEQFPVRLRNKDGCELFRKSLEKLKAEPSSVFAAYTIGSCS